MSASSRLTLDTNILLYAAVEDATPRHRIAERIVRRAALCDCVLILQALAEFVWASTRKSFLSLDQATMLVDSWLLLFPTTHATPATLARALEAVRRHRIAFWDAMLWAVAREAGCRYLLSEDFQAGRTLDGVTFVNPFTTAGLPDEVERALGQR